MDVVKVEGRFRAAPESVASAEVEHLMLLLLGTEAPVRMPASSVSWFSHVLFLKILKPHHCRGAAVVKDGLPRPLLRKA